MTSRNTETVLVLGGLDPSGGAGILADCAAVRSRGLHCAAVCTLETVQDGTSFLASSLASLKRVSMAVEAILGKQVVGAIKTGALGDAEMVRFVAGVAHRDSGRHLVVDPVMESSSGGELLDEEGVNVLREHLLPLATIVTPNMAEASRLTGLSVDDLDSMKRAALRILELGPDAVLVKGGHLNGRPCDVFARRDVEPEILDSDRIDVGEVRGTGCGLASLVACSLAGGSGVRDAVLESRAILRRAIEGSYRAGSGARFLRYR